MRKHKFNIVDVFATEKYTGNQLAVIRNARTFSDDEMLRITKEMNYSETTFILSDTECDGGYKVRIFTPEREVLFAGHPTLGTAFVIQREIVRKPVNTLTLNLKAGQVPVTFTYSQGEPSILWMKQLHPSFRKTLCVNTIAEILQLDPKEIDQQFPIQEVSTGLAFIIVPLKTLTSLKSAIVQVPKYRRMIQDLSAKAILIFCPETRHLYNDLSVRVFANYYGIPEDPATGSANGCLAAYLVKHQYFGENHINLSVEQGYAVGRPSQLFLRTQGSDGRTNIFVGGRTIMVAKGELV